MLRSLLRTLRQPRYAALTVFMVVVAAVCVTAGTWQIARLAAKVGTNAELRRNAHAPAAAVADVLPLVGDAAGHPAANTVHFRSVHVSGTFDAGHQTLVRQRSVDGDTGFFVLTPIRSAEGTLLVARGFISGTTTTGTPSIPPPPAGQVSVLARVHPGETRHDQFDALHNGQVESVNPGEQAARLGTPVFDGYAVLEPGQPGVAPLVAIPSPDLSNPAGGAVEPQHVAYVIQWYLFAALALAAPIAMARAETRQRADGDDEFGDAAAPAEAAADERARAAKLADRYGRPVR